MKGLSQNLNALLENITIKKLSLDDLLFIYDTYGPQFFPPDELKPTAAIKRLFEAGLYCGYGIYLPENTVCGFALFVFSDSLNGVLLDYYAVLPQYRNGGFGGKVLSLLSAAFPDNAGIYIESENPAFAKNTDELDLQTRRIGFYERNGAQKTGLKSCLFGVHYEVLYLECGQPFTALSTQTHYENVDAIYKTMFFPKYYGKETALTF